MDTFSIIRDAVAATEVDPDHEAMNQADREIGRVVAAVQVVVDVLTPPDGGRYIVGFADISTAATALNERRIIVSSKPLRDATLTLVEKAVVIATFAAHEIGHTVITAPRKDLITSHNSHSGYHAVANVADDIVLEPWMVNRYPILQDAFEFTGQWVLRTTAEALPKIVTMKRDMKTPERFNAVLSATRYGDCPEIVWNGKAAEAERDWARDWKDRLLAAPVTDHDTFIAHCDELWDRIRTVADEDPEPPIIDCPIGPVGPRRDPKDEPPDEDGEDEGKGEDDEDGEDEGKGKGEGKPTDPNDGPREWDDDDKDKADGESDEGSDDIQTEPESDGGDESDGEDEGDGESDEGSDDIQTEPTGDITGDNPDPDRDRSRDGEGGGGNSEATSRDEDDFDMDEVDKSTHDQAERVPFDVTANHAEQVVRSFASTTTTSFGIHGTISTRWD